MKQLVNILIFLCLPQLSNAINLTDAYHKSNSIFYVNPSAGEIKLKVKQGSIIAADVIVVSERTKMQIEYQDTKFDYYVAKLNKFDVTTTYHFVLKDLVDSLRFPTNKEFKSNVPLFTIPDWAIGKTYYSIFTDGFYNEDKTNDPEETITWGAKPKNWLSYGGDLKGIIRQIAYIDSLNPDIIILQPIFSASSNHKLNPKDYATMDPSLGDTIDLKNLIDEIHNRNKKIILSVIFTHTGTDFPTFEDVVKNGKESKYTDWYLIKSLPIKTSPPNYACWRSDYRFPKLNLRNAQVKNYLIGYLEYWKHFGFDGFYVGESEKIDPNFVKALRTHLKIRYPNLLLLGSDMRLLTGNGFDGCSNESFTDMLMDYFITNTITGADLDRGIQKLLFFNPPQSNSINIINLSGYDKRIYNKASADIIKNIYAFIFTFVGSPVILYGDEIGFSDCTPLNLGSLPWYSKDLNRDLLEEIKKLIKIRKTNPQISSNNFFTLYINDITQVYAYDRGGLIVVLNSGDRQSFVELPAWDGVYFDLITSEKLTAYSQKLKLSINPKSYRILKREI